VGHDDAANHSSERWTEAYLCARGSGYFQAFLDGFPRKFDEFSRIVHLKPRAFFRRMSNDPARTLNPKEIGESE